jgi:hypothetical protein
MVLLGSILPKDSNGILFAIFGCRDQKIWVLQDCTRFCFVILKRIRFKTEGCHVAHRDWPIPVREDQQWESLDLMKSGRTRSVDTGSVKWTILGD